MSVYACLIIIEKRFLKYQRTRQTCAVLVNNCFLFCETNFLHCCLLYVIYYTMATWPMLSLLYVIYYMMVRLYSIVVAICDILHDG